MLSNLAHRRTVIVDLDVFQLRSHQRIRIVITGSGTLCTLAGSQYAEQLYELCGSRSVAAEGKGWSHRIPTPVTRVMDSTSIELDLDRGSASSFDRVRRWIWHFENPQRKWG